MSKPPDKAHFVDLAHRMKLANVPWMPMGFAATTLYIMDFAKMYQIFYLRSANE